MRLLVGLYLDNAAGNESKEDPAVVGGGCVHLDLFVVICLVLGVFILVAQLVIAVAVVEVVVVGGVFIRLIFIGLFLFVVVTIGLAIQTRLDRLDIDTQLIPVAIGKDGRVHRPFVIDLDTFVLGNKDELSR